MPRFLSLCEYSRLGEIERSCRAVCTFLESDTGYPIFGFCSKLLESRSFLNPVLLTIDYCSALVPVPSHKVNLSLAVYPLLWWWHQQLQAQNVICNSKITRTLEDLNWNSFSLFPEWQSTESLNLSEPKFFPLV